MISIPICVLPVKLWNGSTLKVMNSSSFMFFRKNTMSNSPTSLRLMRNGCCDDSKTVLTFTLNCFWVLYFFFKFELIKIQLKRNSYLSFFRALLGIETLNINSFPVVELWRLIKSLLLFVQPPFEPVNWLLNFFNVRWLVQMASFFSSSLPEIKKKRF